MKANGRVCDAAVVVLRETNNPAVMQGDDGLIYLIAARAGLVSSRGPADRAKGNQVIRIQRAVLGALSRQPGTLVARKTRTPRGRWVRIFYLPDHCPIEQRTADGQDQVD